LLKTPYVTYLNSDLVVKSNKGSTRTLIPAIVTDINKSTGVSDPMVTSGNDVPGFSDN
jgi:hypothetical protein